jgi:hypothetical protein
MFAMMKPAPARETGTASSKVRSLLDRAQRQFRNDEALPDEHQHERGQRRKNRRRGIGACTASSSEMRRRRSDVDRSQLAEFIRARRE